MTLWACIQNRPRMHPPRESALNSTFVISTQLLQNHLSQKLQRIWSGFELSPESQVCLHLVPSQCASSPTSSLVTFFTTLTDVGLFTSESIPAPSCLCKLGTEASPATGLTGLSAFSRLFTPSTKFDISSQVSKPVTSNGFGWGNFWSWFGEGIFRGLRKVRISCAPEAEVRISVCRFVFSNVSNINTM